MNRLLAIVLDYLAGEIDFTQMSGILGSRLKGDLVDQGLRVPALVLHRTIAHYSNGLTSKEDTDEALRQALQFFQYGRGVLVTAAEAVA